MKVYECEEICPTCKGKGYVDVYDNGADDVIPVPCPDCCYEDEEMEEKYTKIQICREC